MAKRRPVGQEKPRQDYSPDRGCQYAPRCLTCPWSRCVKELPADERQAFRGALLTLAPYVRRADGVLG